MEALKEKLLKDIKETGYPLELNISNVFQTHNWKVLHNAYYIDKDEMKGREIDLHASDHLSTTDEITQEYFEYKFRLTVEIKQSNKKPWVFFTTPTSKFSFPSYQLAYSPSSEVEDGDHIFKPVFFKENYFYQRTGKSFYEGFTKNGGRDDIFKALSGSVKAMYHFKENCYALKHTSSEILIESFAPVVVIDGDLFEAFINSKNELELVESNYVPVEFNYLSPNYISDSEDRSSNEFLVHVVKSSYLSEFLEDYRLKQNGIFQKLLKQSNEMAGTHF